MVRISRPTVSPGVPRGTAKAEMPDARPSSGVRAKTVKTLAHDAESTKVFVAVQDPASACVAVRPRLDRTRVRPGGPLRQRERADRASGRERRKKLLPQGRPAEPLNRPDADRVRRGRASPASGRSRRAAGGHEPRRSARARGPRDAGEYASRTGRVFRNRAGRGEEWRAVRRSSASRCAFPRIRAATR